MSNEKLINSRQQQKIDTSENWRKAVNFVPLAGEIIVYSDLNRIKIGDGVTKINDLDFSTIGKSTPEGGEIFNDYENNQAFSPYSASNGYNSFAGACGYKVLSVINDTAANISKITVNDKDLEDNNKAIATLEIEDIINFDGTSHYVNSLKATNFETNEEGNTVITLTTIDGNDIPVLEMDRSEPTDLDPIESIEDWIWCAEKPYAGIVGGFSRGAIAGGENSAAIGRGASSHGRETKAMGHYSHAEGRQTFAAYAAHAEGSKTKANGYCSHAEGSKTVANGSYSHAEGGQTVTNSDYSHAEGGSTIANGKAQHVQGKWNIEDIDIDNNGYGRYAHIVGNGSNVARSNAHTLDWKGNAWFKGDVRIGGVNYDEGQILATNEYVGRREAYIRDDVEKRFNTRYITAGKKAGSKLGVNVTAEGHDTTASGDYAHAEGLNTVALGSCSHAEGAKAEAIASWSHAEGYDTKATEKASHAEGYSTVASGLRSHAEGNGTIAAGDIQHVQGRFNIVDTGTNSVSPNKKGEYLHIVGNGKSDTQRSDAHTLDWDGNAWFAGNITVGGEGQNDPNAKKVATEVEIDELYKELSAQDIVLDRLRTLTGDIIAHDNVIDGSILKAWTEILPTQEGEGAPAKENVRPFILYNQVVLNHSGKNFLNHLDIIESSGTPGSLDNAEITPDYVNIVRKTQFDYTKIPVYVEKGTPYTLWVEFEVYDRNEGEGRTTFDVASNELFGGHKSTNVQENGTYTICLNTISPISGQTLISFNANYGSIVPAKVKFRAMFVEGTYSKDTIPEFEPYNGRTYTTGILNEAFCGGICYWNEGKIIPTYNYIESYAGEEVPEGWISSTGELSEGAQIVYPVKNGEAIAFTPQEIIALSGTNYLYSHPGETSVKQDYVKIDRTLSQNGMAADAYVVGEAIRTIDETIALHAGVTTNNGGEIFNDYENNQAISEFSTASGHNTQVGQKGYYWFNLDLENKSFTLSTTQLVDTPVTDIPWTFSAEQPCYLSLSDESNAFTNCCKIEEIFENNDRLYIRVNALPEIKDIRGTLPEGYEGVYICDFAVWCVDQPEAGVVDIGLGSNTSGVNNIARGMTASATGYLTNATGLFSHTEGLRTTASGERGHAEGSDSVASGATSHAEGYTTTASGDMSHAEGSKTTAEARTAHAEGYDTHATANYAHSEGTNTTASGEASHAEGYHTEATGKSSHSEGSETHATNNYAHAEGYNTTASGANSHTEGSGTHAIGKSSHAEGAGSIANGDFSHAEGRATIASIANQHVQGKYNIEDKDGDYAHIVGWGSGDTKRANIHTLDTTGKAWFKNNVYIGGNNQQEGAKIVATQEYVDNKAATHYITAGRVANSIVGYHSTAEGGATTASGQYAHAEGGETIASGAQAHSEGYQTKATASSSHAEGYKTQANGKMSHAEGTGTIATSENQHVQGKYNIPDYQIDKYGKIVYDDNGNPVAGNNYLHIVGNGNSSASSNAHTLDWGGNAWFAGSVESTGIKSNGNIEFGNTSNYLSWTTNDNTQIHMRPYAPTNVFQITMQNPGAGITEYGALSIHTNGKIELGGPLYTQGLVLKYKETYGSEADMYSIANPVEGQIFFVEA